jgi:hypothetical protein
LTEKRDDDKPTVTADKDASADRLRGFRDAFERPGAAVDAAMVPAPASGALAEDGAPDEGEPRPFVRQAWFQEDALLGARWWNESFQAFVAAPAPADTQARRHFLTIAAVLLSGGILLGWEALQSRRRDDDLPDNVDALELQRRAGWDVGHPSSVPGFDGATIFDAAGASDWRARLRDLAAALSPDPRLAPYAVPTLFQSLADPANERLRAMLRPIRTPEMEEAFARGQALAELATKPDAPSDLALIIDLPGPSAVAVAAGLSARFAPVFTFDNWPHPLGVVPSHLTLGAAVYHRPTFEAAARSRPQPSPPAFVLDSNRLNPYRDQADTFDNRYVARLPAASNLQALGVRRILYVRPDASSLTELDDLNDDFVAYERAGIEVRALALTDFSQSDLRLQAAAGRPVYYYGGHPYHHTFFWSSYHWSPAPTLRPARAPAPRLSSATSYRPAARPTMFSSRTIGGGSGVGKQKPSGFGRVSMRSGGYGSYSSSSRSGSFGRSRSSSSG